MVISLMPVDAALGVLVSHRANEIVVTTMGATREWSRLSDSSLDFHYLPSAMGHAPMVGLGLALALPQREVVVINGDGSQLMGLGNLVTIAAQRPGNFTLLVLQNDVYEVTGGQSTPASGIEVDYALLARGAGFPTAITCHDLTAWKRAATSLFQLPSPRFVTLRVAAVRHDVVPQPLAPMAERIARFRTAIEREVGS